jgi:DNA-binding IclR family transcriptional regulator
VRIGGPVVPGDLAGATDLPKATLHRLFQTLEAEGYLQREPDGRSYSVGPRARQLAVATLSTMRVRTARLAVMRALAKDTGETCNVAIPNREAMVYLDRVETEWPLRVQFSVGTQVPLYCTASGKLYLSTLSDLRLSSFCAMSISLRWRRTPSPTRGPARRDRDDPRAGLRDRRRGIPRGRRRLRDAAAGHVRADAGDDLVPGADPADHAGTGPYSLCRG